MGLLDHLLEVEALEANVKGDIIIRKVDGIYECTMEGDGMLGSGLKGISRDSYSAALRDFNWQAGEKWSELQKKMRENRTWKEWWNS